ncbi:MAG: hypothetical protein QOH83_1608 [Solirubrobacteraceae bacterium]|jgi:hypothetical protein|nr:hypothetical protein [Solirubrobacteraceae bacterium]
MVAAMAAEPRRRAGPYRDAVNAPGRISVLIGAPMARS